MQKVCQQVLQFLGPQLFGKSFRHDRNRRVFQFFDQILSDDMDLSILVADQQRVSFGSDSTGQDTSILESHDR